MKLQRPITMAQLAKRGLLGIAFLAGGVGLRAYDGPPGSLSRLANGVRFEPPALLLALTMVTRRIGLVATGSMTGNEQAWERAGRAAPRSGIAGLERGARAMVAGRIRGKVLAVGGHAARQRQVDGRPHRDADEPGECVERG